MQITGAVLRAAHAPFTIETLDLAEPRPDEVLVRIVAAGLCHTDLAVRDQSLPFALPGVVGHEGAGIVEKIGDSVTRVKPGDKVALTFAFCGHCTNCNRRDVAYCENAMGLNYAGVRADGSDTLSDANGHIGGHFFGQSSFATHALANELNTIKLAEDASLILAAPLGCGIQTGAGAVMRSLAAVAGRSIAIFGGGSVGLSAVMGAVVRQCHPIVVVEPFQSRRALALELGATHAVDPAAGDVPEQIRTIAGRGMDYAVDTTGSINGVQSAMSAMARRGTMAWLGVPKDPAAAIPLSLLGFLASGNRLKAVIEGDSDPDLFIPELLALQMAGRFPIEKLVTTFRFEDINVAVDAQLAGAVIKPVLTF